MSTVNNDPLKVGDHVRIKKVRNGFPRLGVIKKIINDTTFDVKLDLVGYDQTTEIVETVTDPKIIEKTGMKLEEDPKQPVKLEDLRLSFAHELQPSK